MGCESEAAAEPVDRFLPGRSRGCFDIERAGPRDGLHCSRSNCRRPGELSSDSSKDILHEAQERPPGWEGASSISHTLRTPYGFQGQAHKIRLPGSMEACNENANHQ